MAWQGEAGQVRQERRLSEMDDRRKRFWTYSREEWQPEHRWLHPGYSWRFFGGDEWDRWTIILPIPFGGYLVTALFECGECRRGNEDHGDINIAQSLLAYFKKRVPIDG